MLSQRTVALLAALAYRPDADWRVNVLPFGSIYWNDEMPSLGELLDRADDVLILHAMFRIRMRLWDGEALNAQDQQLWDAVEGEIPSWPLFKRLRLSDEQKLARHEAELQAERAFETFGYEHDSA